MARTTTIPEKLSLQERVIAEGMRRKVGDIAAQGSIDNSGNRRHSVSFDDHDLPELAGKFAKDPKESLAYARENLFAVAHEGRRTPEQRAHRLDRYFDAYVDLTLRLDHAAFPPTPLGTVYRGIPEYIPDGFVDLGGDDELEPKYRYREQVLVDKKEILEKYAPVLKRIFSTDYTGRTLNEKKRHMAAMLAQGVYYAMPYDHGFKDLGGDKVPLSELDEGVCRHQALTFQVLAQTVGLSSRIFKSHMDGVRHSTNMIRIDGEWRILDITNPDFVEKSDGTKEWRPGSYKIDRPPLPGEAKQYEVTQRFSGQKHIYRAHGEMFSYISEV